MKIGNILSIVALLGLGVAMPNVVMADTCQNVGVTNGFTLQSLMTAGTCTIDGLAFTFNSGSFDVDSLTGGGSAPATASQVTYTVDNGPVANPLNVPIYGFEFNPDLSVTGVGSADLLIHYTVSASSDVLSSLHVALTGTVLQDNVNASVVEDDIPCLGPGQTNCGAPLNPDLQVSKGSSGTTLYDDIAFAPGGPYQSFAVTKDINVTSINTLGFANISDVRDAFDKVVPEPASVSFVALGLLGLVGAVRRYRKQA